MHGALTSSGYLASKLGKVVFNPGWVGKNNDLDRVMPSCGLPSGSIQ